MFPDNSSYDQRSENEESIQPQQVLHLNAKPSPTVPLVSANRKDRLVESIIIQNFLKNQILAFEKAVQNDLLWKSQKNIPAKENLNIARKKNVYLECNVSASIDRQSPTDNACITHLDDQPYPTANNEDTSHHQHAQHELATMVNLFHQ